MTSESNGDGAEVSQICDVVRSPNPGHDVSSAHVTGWMYVNQNGQMCGPYTQEQLYEGLSTGFLPEEIPVYPMLNGNLLNPVPLNYFKRFPDHVATGFVYLNAAVYCVKESADDGHDVDQQNLVSKENKNMDASYHLSEESCWLFEDEEGRKHGPHSLSELYAWCHYGYMRNSVMIYHAENKYSPLDLESLLNTWRSMKPEAHSVNDSNQQGIGLPLNLIFEISEEVCKQLHFGIMKTARKVLLDEIVSCIISDSLATRKTQKSRKSERCHEKKDFVAAETGVDACNTAEGQHSGEAAISLPNLKSIGSSENFCASYMAVSRMVFNSCLQVMWNSIFRDHIANYSSEWRRMKLWSSPNYAIKQCIPHQEVSLQVEKLPTSIMDEQDSFISDIDCPPGFEPTRTKVGPKSLAPPVSSSLARDKPSGDNLFGSGASHDDMEFILECILNELHSSSKLALVQYFEGLVNEEVKKVVDFPQSIYAKEVNCCFPHLHYHSSVYDNEEDMRLPSNRLLEDPQCSPILTKYPSHQNIGHCCEVTLTNLSVGAFQKLPIHLHDPTNIEVGELLPTESEENMEQNVPLHIRRAEFQNLPMHLDDADEAVGIAVIDELRPSKSEEITEHCTLSPNWQVQSFKLDWHAWKPTFQVALMLSRQQIHDHVMQKLKSLYLEDVIEKAVTKTCYSWRYGSTKKKYNKVTVDLLNKENSDNGDSSLETTLLMGKYVYSRRRKLASKRSRSLFQSLTMADTDNLRQASKKSKKAYTVKSVAQPTQGKDGISSNLVKRALEHNIGQYADARIHGEKTPLEKTSSLPSTSQMLENAAHANQVSCTMSKASKLKRKRVSDHGQHSQLGKVQKQANGIAAQALHQRVNVQKIKRKKAMKPCPQSNDCARSSINGWEWRTWAASASPSERTRVRGTHIYSPYVNPECSSSQPSNVKGHSARTNRAKLRNLLAAAEGADLLKATQLKARKKRLCFQRSNIHDWGLIALEPIEAEDFVIEYVGELIRPCISDIREHQYEKMGIGSSYLFRLDDGYVVDATSEEGLLDS